MGLMNQAYNTYCAMETQYSGIYIDGKEPLVPISHQIVKAEIEITINSKGRFLNAHLVDKGDAATIIPVTEQSAGRVGDTSCAHPLCDQIRFLTPLYPQKYAAYLTQLHRWETSPYSHPKLHAIALYVEKGTILDDLEQVGILERDEHGLPLKEKQVVRWRIDSGNENDISACWMDQSLFQSFIHFYESSKQGTPVFCMISGEYALPAKQHSKKIINTSANAKLISSNDTSGFTYRGRFTDDSQAMTMGYVVSQKIHNAIHWLAANQGVYIGGRTFLCWNPNGILIPQPHATFLQRNRGKQMKYSDYQKALHNTLCGWKETIPPDTSAIVAAFDAATSGRLALTYYSEMLTGDFLDRLHRWDLTCCWEHFPYGVQSPSLYEIINCAFGTQRSSGNQAKLETDDRIMRQQMQRLISCRVDKRKIPEDIVQAVESKASNLQILEKEIRETVLSTACAVIRKKHYDQYQEEWKMALEPDKQDISYQYGRLLAVFEKVERDTYDSNEAREPNAIRMQSIFSRRPQYASRLIWEQLKQAYFPKLSPASKSFYDHLISEIVEKISVCPQQGQTSGLKDSYFMGYYLQRSALYTSKSKKTTQEEEV